jgi:hypothetical protein
MKILSFSRHFWFSSFFFFILFRFYLSRRTPRKKNKEGGGLEVKVLPLLLDLALELGVLLENVLHRELVNGLGGLEGLELILEIAELLLDV